jgi:small-conductance mechanosensitive channel
MMKLAAMRTEGVSRDHEPYVYTLALNQFDVTYELTVHLETGSSYFETRSRLNRNVLDAFNEFGVQIMTPAYEGDPEGRKVVPKSQWFAAPSSPKEAAAKAETHDNTLKQAG